MTYPKLKYLTDQDGERTAVVIDINDWLELQEEFNRLTQREEMKKQLKNAFEEVKLYKKGEKDLMTLEDFLEHEC